MIKIDKKVMKMEEFFSTAYELIYGNDLCKIEVFKYEFNKMLAHYLKSKKKELQINYLTKFYYKLLNNKIYQSVNKNTITIVNLEIYYLQTIMEILPEATDSSDLNMMLNIFEMIIEMDKNLDAYIKTNINPGRTVEIDFFLETIDKYLDIIQEYVNDLSTKHVLKKTNKK